MSYYGAGDYYAAGGFLDFIGKGINKLAGVVKGTGVPVVSQLAGGVQALTTTSPALRVPGFSGTVAGFGPTPQIIPVPGLEGKIQRLLPGGKSGYMFKKRRRMNVANSRALRRAIRREQGFVRLARRALKGTAYSVVTKGSRRRRSPIVVETGEGSVNLGR